MKTIILCTTQRSGSTRVCEDMTRVGLGKPNEYFLSWIGREDLNWEQELQNMIQQHSHNGVFSVKIMANQIRRIDTRLARTIAPLDSGPFPHFRAVFPQAEWVFIQRKDVIDQAISHFLAKNSGVYHVIKSGQGFLPGAALHESAAAEKITEVEYDYSALLAEWHSLQAGNLLWQEFFRETGIEPTHIEYATYDKAMLTQYGQDLGIVLKTPDGVPNMTKMPNTRNLKIKDLFKRDLFSRI